jgi:hypothetical protein
MTSQPSASFVPLTALPAPTVAREYRVAIINRQGIANGNGHPNGNGQTNGNGQDHANGNGNRNGNGNGAPKKPAFHSLDQLQPATRNGAEAKPCEPRVTVQRDGNRVTHLRIQCTCGQIMDLACVYDETPPAA